MANMSAPLGRGVFGFTKYAVQLFGLFTERGQDEFSGMEDTAGVGNADGLGGETKFCLERANHERQLKRSRFIQRGSGCVASPGGL